MPSVVPATRERVLSRSALTSPAAHRIRLIKIVVGGTPLGKQVTWAYPAGTDLGFYMVPIYNCTVEGTDDAGASVTRSFQVLRFGVQSKDGKKASVVGLADRQRHVIKAWIPSYTVHSANSPENGAWQVYDNFLIHDGPDTPEEVFATIGCIEIMGKTGFIKFNDLLIALSGSKASSRNDKLHEIGRSGRMSITYEAAVRPPLEKAP
ncbi:MAG: hypothetical protein WAQ08_15315 [Aquabacterium sp.]|uniref:hypothetical protein n=1 Tax=Aquabacterium sp. TaxID=1872578 RepID=UPI003BAFF9C9